MTCEPWPVTWTGCVEGIDARLVDQAAQLAVSLLSAMAGGRILGACTYDELYLPPAATGDCGVPYLDDRARWHNGGRRGADCCRLLLEHRPVRSIEAVLVNGTALDAGDWRLDGGWLLRVGACWPHGAVCDEPPIRVQYTAGASLPAGTDLAVGEVAWEYLQAIQNKACKLPSRATSISRQGVTVELGDAADFLAAGRLGLPLADAWLRIVNPTGHKVRPKVYSPDLPRASRVRA